MVFNHKTFKEIKNFDTIKVQTPYVDVLKYLNASFKKKVSIYFPFEEGVILTELPESELKNSYNVYYYFDRIKEIIEIYIYDRNKYEFIFVVQFQILNITKKKIKIIDKDSRFDKITINALFEGFVQNLIYIIDIKDNTESVIKTKNNKKNILSSNTSNNNLKNTTIIKLNNKVVYEANNSSPNNDFFKKKYKRHTYGWSVMGFPRHYKSGKVVYVKPHVRGKKDKIKKKEYIV